MVGKSLNTMILINKAQYDSRISRMEFWFSLILNGSGFRDCNLWDTFKYTSEVE